MLKQGLVIFMLIFSASSICFAIADVPTNVNLTATMDSITVTWDGDGDADGYYVYWGIETSDMHKETVVGSTTTTYTITGLESGTTYYVQVSAYDNDIETALTAVKSITTERDSEPPPQVVGLDVTDIKDVSENSVPLTWTPSEAEDLARYVVKYGTSSGNYTWSVDVDKSDHTVVVSGLDSGKRYYFIVIAIDESENESEKSTELVVDTLPDNNPPDPPVYIEAVLSGQNQVTVYVTYSAPRMPDFKDTVIYWGQSQNSYVDSKEIGDDTTYTIDGLEEDTVWYITANACDIYNNCSDYGPEVSIRIERTMPLIDPDSDFSGGCFLSSLFGGSDEIEDDVEDYRNRAGISASWLAPAESKFNNHYGNDTYLVSCFYERKINESIGLDLTAGYFKRHGNLITESGKETTIDSTITLIPVSASVQYQFPIAPFVSGYIGCGPDYWYCREETVLSDGASRISEWVSGYHGKAGLWLYNMDPEFSNLGAVVECRYSKINRMGKNSIDLGGWIFSLGFFYGF